MSSGNISFEELNLLSEKITSITHQLEEKELRWLQLSENI